MTTKALRPSFRRRHPVIFFLLMLVGLAVCLRLLFGLYRSLEDSGSFSGPRLGVLRVEGFIGDAEDVVEWADTLRRDKSVAGVLVRIDSPGGAVAPSQEIHAAVRRLAAEKPVVVSMGSVAASGGYYVAVAGKEIFANPSTLTGSIGVRLQVTNVQGLMERLGVSSHSLTTGPLKAAGSPFEPLSPAQRAYFEALIQDMQAEFVRAVCEGRDLPPESVLPYADGRAMTGRQALEAKLVDRIGDRHSALVRLTELSGLEGIPALKDGPPKTTPWWRKLISVALDLEAARSADTSHYMFHY